MQGREAALAGAPADRGEDHLVHLADVHEAMGAQKAQDLDLARGPDHGENPGVVLIVTRRDGRGFVGTFVGVAADDRFVGTPRRRWPVARRTR